jgi:hypothetical protein
MRVPKLNNIVALSILVCCTLCGCKKTGSQAVAPQPAITSQTVNPFGNSQNDAEGFSKHAWGQSVDDFKSSFIQTRQTTDAAYSEASFNSALGEGCSSEDQYLSYYAWRAMEKLEEVPGDGDSAYFADKRFLPDVNVVFCDYKELSDYFFYKGKLAYVVVAVDSDPTPTLSAKYSVIGTTSFTTSDRLNGLYEITLYKRGATNTRIYDVAYSMKDSPMKSRFLIYIPTRTLYELGAEVTAKVSAAKVQQLKENQTVQQGTEQRVQ